MRKSHVVGSILIALLLGFVVGWFARPADVAPSATAHAPAPRADVAGGTTTMGDEHDAWAKVPSTSPDYATAQRLLGYNYFAHDRHDLAEAKRHVDLALAASPDDPKVLEDAGRVYVMAGLTAEGTAMLQKADTPVAHDFLARR
jgi:Flp pilus assembly protein TadD